MTPLDLTDLAAVLGSIPSPDGDERTRRVMTMLYELARSRANPTMPATEPDAPASPQPSPVRAASSSPPPDPTPGDRQDVLVALGMHDPVTSASLPVR